MSLLKSLRESAGLSQRELANRVGVSRTKVYNLEQRSNLTEDLSVFARELAKTINLSYVAGLFDRNSTISIIRDNKHLRFDPNQKHCSPSYVAKIQFTSKHKLLVDIIKQVFGVGEVCFYRSSNLWIYYAHNKSVDVILEKLLPFLRLKREKALILQEFRVFLEKNTYSRPDQNRNKFFTISEFSARYGLSHQFVYLALTQHRLDGFFKEGRWYVYDVIDPNYRKGKGKGRQLTPDVLAKYEEFYTKIRQAP